MASPGDLGQRGASLWMLQNGFSHGRRISQPHPSTPGLVPRAASPTHVLTLSQQGGPGHPDLLCLQSKAANSEQTLVTPDSCSPLTKKESQLWLR